MCSIGRVPCAAGVEQSAPAPVAVLNPGVKEQLSSAKSGVEVARGGVKERIPTNSCIGKTGGEIKKRVAPFGHRVIGIAPVRRRTNPLRNGLRSG